MLMRVCGRLNATLRGLKLMAPLHSEIRAGFSEKGGTTGGWRSKDGKCQEACSKTKIVCQAYLISQVSVTNT